MSKPKEVNESAPPSPELLLKAEVGTLGKVKKGVDMLLDAVMFQGAKVGEISFVAEVRGAERGFRIVVYETIPDQVT